MSTKKGKRIKKSKQSLKNLWDAFKHNNIPFTGVSEEEGLQKDYLKI